MGKSETELYISTIRSTITLHVPFYVLEMQCRLTEACFVLALFAGIKNNYTFVMG